MAVISIDPTTIKWAIYDQSGNPVFGCFMTSEGTSSAYPVLFLTDADTTYYYWPTASTGALRYGTSAPSTRGSDGSAQ